jgi:hypothetical protein
VQEAVGAAARDLATERQCVDQASLYMGFVGMS